MSLQNLYYLTNIVFSVAIFILGIVFLSNKLNEIRNRKIDRMKNDIEDLTDRNEYIIGKMDRLDEFTTEKFRRFEERINNAAFEHEKNHYDPDQEN